MISMIEILVRKKLSFLTIVFMILSYFLIMGIGIYSSGMNEEAYELYTNLDVYYNTYISTILEIVPLLLIGFLIVLGISECNNKMNSFDAYFLVDFNKKSYLFMKVISSLLIITVYYVMVFEGVIIIYLYCYKTDKYLMDLIYTALYLYLYIVIVFFVIRLLTDFFTNSFILLIPLVLYYLMRILYDYSIYKVLKYFIVTPIYNYKTFNLSFNISIYYVLGYLLYFIITDFYCYNKKDLKI